MGKLNAEASAQSEIAMELSTGKVLIEGNADARLPMASTTKILTALIIIEDCNLDEEITVPEVAVGAEGSSIYLKKDERIDIRDLLYGLMLRSGNDSAAALAIHHSGSIEKFAEAMNDRARKIGTENSNFKNPSGLPDNEHYTTARDLCKIACYAMNNPTFKQIVSTINYKGKYRSFVNKNKMLRMCEGANGVKTGYTLKAGRCLVSSAERNGMDIVCVVLNCRDMYERSCAIFDSCFDNYKLLKLDENKVFMCNIIPCKLEKSEQIVVKTKKEIRYEVKPVAMPTKIRKGDEVAELEIYGENDLLFSRKLYSI
ncbi:MAG: D-alanyl-D-alanine carboxypeptidase [Clostridia bacterium]|nr:D-alanyl-D-alanine carboxypeptidase [Clostridia bacterium]